MGWMIGDSTTGRSWELFSSSPRPDRLGGPPSFLSSGYQGLFPWGLSGCGKLTIRVHLVPRSRIRATIPPLLQYAFMARCSVTKSTGATVPLPLPLPLSLYRVSVHTWPTCSWERFVMGTSYNVHAVGKRQALTLIKLVTVYSHKLKMVQDLLSVHGRKVLEWIFSSVSMVTTLRAGRPAFSSR
jgi:hypothetical protein